jgi:hypothetical protein
VSFEPGYPPTVPARDDGMHWMRLASSYSAASDGNTEAPVYMTRIQFSSLAWHVHPGRSPRLSGGASTSVPGVNRPVKLFLFPQVSCRFRNLGQGYRPSSGAGLR